jgi:hypothetical protein
MSENIPEIRLDIPRETTINLNLAELRDAHLSLESLRIKHRAISFLGKDTTQIDTAIEETMKLVGYFEKELYDLGFRQAEV